MDEKIETQTPDQEALKPDLSQLKEDPIIKFIMRHGGVFKTAAILLMVLGVAVFGRINTFWLPHWMGDQCQYVSLAMKLDRFGFNHYNLRGVDVGYINFDEKKIFRLVYPKPAKDITSKGMMLEGLELVGISYYDQPFFHKPPAFPYLIMLSHRIFAMNKDLYTIVLTNIGPYLSKAKPKIFLDSQFYAVIIPFMFSLGMVVLAFTIGKMLFSDKIGLYAAFLFAIQPISIWTAHKIWADDMVSFFVNLSVILILAGYKYKKDWLLILAGLFCGIGVLTKQTAGYLVFVVILFFILANEKRLDDARNLPKILLDRRIIFFIASVAVVSVFWFIKINKVYHNPLYLPGQTDIAKQDITGWYKALAGRPPGAILFPAVIIYLCPLFVFLIVGIFECARNLIRLILKKSYEYRFIFLGLFVFVYYFFFKSDKEERLILPLMPAISVLAAYGIDRVTPYIFPKGAKNILGNKYFKGAVIGFAFFACAIYSIRWGYIASVNEWTLFMKPF